MSADKLEVGAEGVRGGSVWRDDSRHWVCGCGFVSPAAAPNCEACKSARPNRAPCAECDRTGVPMEHREVHHLVGSIGFLNLMLADYRAGRYDPKTEREEKLTLDLYEAWGERNAATADARAAREELKSISGVLADAHDFLAQGNANADHRAALLKRIQAALPKARLLKDGGA